MNNTESERLAMLADGWQQITLPELKQQLAAIGYKLDRRMDCYSTAQYMTGPRAGMTHPALSLRPVQADDNLSAFHYDARRDANYQRLRELRNTFFVVVPRRGVSYIGAI